MTDYDLYSYAQLRDEVLRIRRAIGALSVELGHIKEVVDKRAGLQEDLLGAQEDEIQKMKKKYRES